MPDHVVNIVPLTLFLTHRSSETFVTRETIVENQGVHLPLSTAS
jgi:hypothetical protein